MDTFEGEKKHRGKKIVTRFKREEKTVSFEKLHSHFVNLKKKHDRKKTERVCKH